MEWLKEVTKHHKLWIKLIYDFGAKENSEDFVQEMYIYLIEKNAEKKLFQNGILNKNYIYFKLRSMWIDSRRKHRRNTDKIKIVRYEDYKKNMEQKTTNEIKRKMQYEIICNKIKTEIYSWPWYDHMTFMFYVNSKKSIRVIAEESSIDKSAISRVLVKCKLKIQEAVKEEIDDSSNVNFDAILEEILNESLFKKIKEI